MHEKAMFSIRLSEGKDGVIRSNLQQNHEWEGGREKASLIGSAILMSDFASKA
jgi:hypothetical protein